MKRMIKLEHINQYFLDSNESYSIIYHYSHVVPNMNNKTVISTFHNTKKYKCMLFYKQISKIINTN